ncbi:hypothetical protein L6164_013684 [Bauhinia variegata]|uniref:Uncharacterized protein n=1 Tax=Bauhinia variegata TaxID=167791 RepID=A0ACB9NF80_BAUVA|nr:hypothetical protein L6164_013684 [Bauhinia variegata]
MDPKQITKKALNATFEDSSETSRESLDFSAISEISDANHKDDFAKVTDCLSSNPKSFSLEDASSETLLSSDLAPSSKDTTGKSSNTSVNRFDAYVLYASAANSDEAEIAVNFLRKAQSEILNSANAAPQYQKLLNEMMKIVIQELCTLPKERDHSAELLSRKKQVLFLSLLIWIIGVSLVIFFISDVSRAFKGPLPT